MGFFYSEKKNSQAKKKKHIPTETLQKLGCKACSLDKAVLDHPKIDPQGSDSEPICYIVGEYPSTQEDVTGELFSGYVGRFLDKKLPEDWTDEDIAFNNCIRCYPGKNKEPTAAQLTCCFPSVLKDIEEVRPFAVVGFGNIALKQFLGQSNINLWRGRRVPVKIGSHYCWFYPMISPGHIVKKSKSQSQKVLREAHELGQILKNDFLLIDKLYNTSSNSLVLSPSFSS